MYFMHIVLKYFMHNTFNYPANQNALPDCPDYIPKKSDNAEVC